MRPLRLFSQSTALLLILLCSQVGPANCDATIKPYPLPCGSPFDIKIRLPPSLNPTVDSDPPEWTPPPQPWLFGNWQITQSTSKIYSSLQNFVFTSTPVLPTCAGTLPADCPLGTFAGQNVDLQTWTVTNGSTTIESAFGYDTPHRANNPSKGIGWEAVYDFAATGALMGLNNSWELLAYGYDEIGSAYLVIYETETTESPAVLDIESRSGSGPSNGTLAAIVTALQGLNNDYITSIIPNMTTLVHNAARSSIAPFVCDPDCVNNTYTQA